jgi:hypothetical protein
MVRDLITRLKAVLAELKAEGNRDLAGRVEQAIRDLERSERPTTGDTSLASRPELTAFPPA